MFGESQKPLSYSKKQSEQKLGQTFKKPNICSTQKRNQKYCAQKVSNNSTSHAPSHWKTVVKRNTKLCPHPIVININNSKQPLQYSEKVMKKDSYYSNANEENTVLEKFDPT